MHCSVFRSLFHLLLLSVLGSMLSSGNGPTWPLCEEALKEKLMLCLFKPLEAACFGLSSDLANNNKTVISTFPRL